MSERERAKLFGDLFADNYRALLAYCIRRTDALADAQDVVAEVFTIAWRRMGAVPDGPDEARMWLYGTARHVLANHHRGRRRAALLSDRLLRLPAQSLLEPRSDDGFEGDLAMAALARLSAPQRELILLSVWEEATLAEIAAIICTSRANASVRLHRAKRALRREFERLLKDHDPPGHVYPMSASQALPEANQ